MKGPEMKEWLKKHVKWIIAGAVILGAIADYSTDTIGLGTLVDTIMETVESTQEAPADPAATATPTTKEQ